jgi:hypothetical protein
MPPEHIMPSVKSYPKSTDNKWPRMGSWLLALLTIQSSPPHWVQKSLPEEWPERGIDAHESGGIFLEWETNPEENIRAYLIHRAQYYEANDSLGDYEMLLRLEMVENNSSSHLDLDVSLKTKYYYRLRVEDESGNYSKFSDSLGFSLLPQVHISLMSPNGQGEILNGDRDLSWRYPIDVEMEDYCLTIVELNSNAVFRQSFTPGDYVDVNESKSIPVSFIFESGEVYKWRIDTGARYINGLETAASESHWATFLYIYE